MKTNSKKIKLVFGITLLTLISTIGLASCGTDKVETENDVLYQKNSAENGNISNYSYGGGCEDTETCNEEGQYEQERYEKDYEKIDLDELEVVIDETSDYGSAGALNDESLTLEDMLLYSIQDEYAARREYAEIIEEFNVERPYTNIISSEETHIAELIEIYETYDMQIPVDNSQEYVLIPESLFEAATVGVQAEINNIAMYDLFLEQDLPEDVREVFEELRLGSFNHLNSFQRQVDRLS